MSWGINRSGCKEMGQELAISTFSLVPPCGWSPWELVPKAPTVTYSDRHEGMSMKDCGCWLHGRMIPFWTRSGIRLHQ